MVRAVQNTASSRTLGGQCARRALQQGLVHGVGDQQPRVVRGHRERFGDLAEASFGDPVHGARQQSGTLGGQGLDTGFLSHDHQTRRAAGS
ncbi:hypothetical protein IWGMT90018_12420 [Mycobacterium kiyosense]|nr:hypothetical protein IWGMT90018_12420 [Mycobacterium kiyosense]